MNKLTAKNTTTTTATTSNSYEHHNIQSYSPFFGHYTIDMRIILDHALTPQAHCVYEILAMVAGDYSRVAHITLEGIADLFHRTPKTVKRWLKSLIEHGVIEQKSPDSFIIHDSIRDSLEAE